MPNILTIASATALLALLAAPAPAAADLLFQRVVPATASEADGASTDVDVSADGRTVVFASAGQNWVDDGFNGTRVVAVDLDTGAIEVVSADSQGVFRGERPAVSADGRYVAFLAYSHPLGANWQVLRKDRQTGALELVSANLFGQAATPGTDDDTLSISGDGRFVAFASAASNLGVGSLVGTEIVVKDMLAGSVELASAKLDGSPSGGYCSLHAHALSGDGRYLTFSCTQDLYVGAGWGQVYVRDLVDNTTQVVSRIGANGAVTTASAYRPAISNNGRYVSFQSACHGGLGAVSGDCTNNSGVYLRDRASDTTTPIARPAALTAAYAESCRESAVSDLGTILLNCSAPAANGGSRDQVFLHVSAQWAPSILSLNGNGQMANGASGYSVAINASGQSMAFESTATDPAPDDHNGVSDIFTVVDPVLLTDMIFANGFD